MQGLFLRFYVHESHRHQGRLVWEWLLERANQMGIRGGSAFRAMAGFGRHHVLHEARFFELAGSLAEQASLVEGPAEDEGKPAEVVELVPRLEAMLAEDVVPGPGLVPVSALDPEPAYGAPAAEAEETEADPQPESRTQPEETLVPEETPEPVPAAAVCVAFASTPRGYRLVELGNGVVPEIGKLVEVPDVGELVVLRHGPSPLPADERVCVFLEPLVRAASTA